MIQSIKITNHLGEVITISMKNPEQSGFFIKGIDGLGPAKSNVNLTEAPSFDGAFFNSVRQVSRNIVLHLGFYNDGFETIEEIRLKSYRFFPMKKPINIEIETDNRIGLTTGYVETNEPDIFSKEESSVISIICPSAFFLGTETIQTFFSGINPMFEFPFENPSLSLKLIEFGSVFISTSGNVYYSGDEETGVVIYINVLGAVNDLGIHNLNTGQSMIIDSAKLIALTGQDLVAGDQIVISTIKGNKYIYLIRNGNQINILNTLVSTSVWFSIERGDNVFTYTADSGVNNLQFLIEHNIVYGGL